MKKKTQAKVKNKQKHSSEIIENQQEQKKIPRKPRKIKEKTGRNK